MTPAVGLAAPDHRRAHRSVATWASGMGSVALVSLAGFFATPWLLHRLGDTRWGAWTVIGEWLGYLGLSQAALGPGAVIIFLLRAHTRGGAPALTAASKRGLQLYVGAALALVPAALALAWWAPVWLQVAPSLITPLRWAVAIAAVGSLALTPPLLFRNVLETVQRGYLVRAALLVQSLLITGLSLWWVWMGWGLIGMAAASVAGMAVGAALWYVWARRFLPHWRTTPPAGIPVGELWHFNWPLLVAMTGNQINQLTDNTLVGLTLGPAAVAGFALTQSLPLLAGTRLSDIGSVSWAALGELKARGEAAFGARVIELAAMLLGAGMVLMATVAVYTRPFVTLWVGARHWDGTLLTWATAASMVVYGFLVFFSWLLDTQGDTRRRMWVSTAGAGLNLGLSLVLVRVWGAGGVALGTVIAYLATDAWFLPYLCVRHYGVAAGALLRALGKAGVRGGIWAAAVVWAAPRLPEAHSWLVLIVEAGVMGAIAAIYCWIVVLRPADRTAWRARWAELRHPQAAGRAPGKS